MKRVKGYIYLFLFAIILLMPCYSEAARGIAVRPTSPSGAEVRGNQWLFVIGIDTYIDWPRLTTAVGDAKSVRDVLFSRYHFDKNHLIELYDEQATRKNILKNLRYLAKKVRKDDSLVIFYAGHGHLDTITKAGSWIPVESGTKDVSAWISNHDIKNYLRVDVIKAKHILLISDSCFSGDFFRGHRGKLPEVKDEVIKKAYELTSRQAVTSGGLEPVADEGFGRNSIFSHFLVKTLKENEKPFLVPSDFFADIKAGVAENTEQFPRFGSLKDTGGQQGGELVLFLKQDAKLKALSTETAARQKEFERLQRMEVAAEEARRKEAEEVVRREKELGELDAKIEAMRKRIGSPAVKADDSLDAMLAIVMQKEEQERRLKELRKQKEEEERKRQTEIASLKRDRDEKVIAMLKPEVEKYKRIVSSKYGKRLKSEAWKNIAAKCR
ncbi:MAG: caspase family protein [Deltaproteobacteria bacterium]|nr:caspase family protein [Deltaproteobacteria bacterium]